MNSKNIKFTSKWYFLDEIIILSRVPAESVCYTCIRRTRFFCLLLFCPKKKNTNFNMLQKKKFKVDVSSCKNVLFWIQFLIFIFMCSNNDNTCCDRTITSAMQAKNVVIIIFCILIFENKNKNHQKGAKLKYFEMIFCLFVCLAQFLIAAFLWILSEPQDTTYSCLDKRLKSFCKFHNTCTKKGKYQKCVLKIF